MSELLELFLSFIMLYVTGAIAFVLFILIRIIRSPILLDEYQSVLRKSNMSSALSKTIAFLTICTYGFIVWPSYFIKKAKLMMEGYRRNNL